MRFPGFEGEWETKKMEDFIDILSGIALQSEDISEDSSGTLILRGINITEGFIRHNKEINRYYPKEIEPKIQKYVLKEKDLVLGMDGSKVGKNVALITGSESNSILIQRVARIRALKNADIDYIFQKFFSKKFQDYVDVVNTSSGIPHISLKQIKDFQTSFPATLIEQQKIASFLSLIDERIQTQNKIIGNLKVQMLGLQEKIFRRKIKMKDEKGNIFPEWELKNGGELFSSVSNKSHNSDLPILAITQDQGAVPRDSIDYQISVTDKSVESYKVVEIGDFIISLRSFQGGIEYSDYKGICSPAYIILKSKHEVEKLFYKYYFKTADYIKLLNKKLEGIRDGKMISYSYFSEIELPYPTINEQIKIASMLIYFERKIEIEKQVLRLYNNQKRYLLKNLFI
ncbi:MAG: restriction endonuclease subunit S [Flavobacterium sp.]|uniref:restriction endonuclease subunit S n=3 Tax=Flavobacterium sp. TaxID=239 RepID=UPI00403421BB